MSSRYLVSRLFVYLYKFLVVPLTHAHTPHFSIFPSAFFFFCPFVQQETIARFLPVRSKKSYISPSPPPFQHSLDNLKFINKFLNYSRETFQFLLSIMFDRVLNLRSSVSADKNRLIKTVAFGDSQYRPAALIESRFHGIQIVICLFNLADQLLVCIYVYVAYGCTADTEQREDIFGNCLTIRSASPLFPIQITRNSSPAANTFVSARILFSLE